MLSVAVAVSSMISPVEAVVGKELRKDVIGVPVEGALKEGNNQFFWEG